jgi:hypothetical protein
MIGSGYVTTDMLKRGKGRNAGFSVAAGVAITLLGVNALATSYPWVDGYPFLAWLAAPVPMLFDGVLNPTLWLLNVVVWAVAPWLPLATWRLVVRVGNEVRANWANPRFMRARRVSLAVILAGMFFVLQYVAVSNTCFADMGWDDTGVWRFRSLFPVKGTTRRLLEIVQPVIVQPTAALVRFAFSRPQVLRGTMGTRWWGWSQGVVEDERGEWVAAPLGQRLTERLWDWHLAVVNTAIWYLLAAGLLRVVRMRLPGLSTVRFVACVTAVVVALGLARYGWYQSARWSGIVAARWDAHRGRLAIYVDAPSAESPLMLASRTYREALQRNLCGVEVRHYRRDWRSAEFAYGYNSVMRVERERRLGRSGIEQCSQRVTQMVRQRYYSDAARQGQR